MRDGHITLSQWLVAAAGASDRALDRRLARHETTRTTWRILHHLANRPSANQADIARLLGVTGATVSHHLDGLEVRELILRYRDPYDRRSHAVEITAHGRDFLTQLTGTADEHEQMVLSFFDPTELPRLIHRLRRLVERLDIEEMGDRAERRENGSRRQLDEILARRHD
jgi:MarR family transcriptional regulator for hemolysin